MSFLYRLPRRSIWPRNGVTRLAMALSPRSTSALRRKKGLRVVKEENKDLLSKLVTNERERKSAQIGLKTAEAQAEDQRKLLYQTEIELATLKQLALDLKAELQKAKEVA